MRPWVSSFLEIQPNRPHSSYLNLHWSQSGVHHRAVSDLTGDWSKDKKTHNSNKFDWDCIMKSYFSPRIFESSVVPSRANEYMDCWKRTAFHAATIYKPVQTSASVVVLMAMSLFQGTNIRLNLSISRIMAINFYLILAFGRSLHFCDGNANQSTDKHRLSHRLSLWLFQEILSIFWDILSAIRVCCRVLS